jgi:hypothetical protein
VFDDRVKQKLTPEEFQALLLSQAKELDAELDAELANAGLTDE